MIGQALREGLGTECLDGSDSGAGVAKRGKGAGLSRPGSAQPPLPAGKREQGRIGAQHAAWRERRAVCTGSSLVQHPPRTHRRLRGNREQVGQRLPGWAGTRRLQHVAALIRKRQVPQLLSMSALHLKSSAISSIAKLQKSVSCAMRRCMPAIARHDALVPRGQVWPVLNAAHSTLSVMLTCALEKVLPRVFIIHTS